VSPDFERLVGRAILDPEFRKQLLDDPDGTVKGAGFVLTDAELDRIREAAKEPEAASRQLESVGGVAAWDG
jgi:Ribosomally synthesized peptide prototyped by Frankia Franean1_4349.